MAHWRHAATSAPRPCWRDPFTLQPWTRWSPHPDYHLLLNPLPTHLLPRLALSPLTSSFPAAVVSSSPPSIRCTPVRSKRTGRSAAFSSLSPPKESSRGSQGRRIGPRPFLPRPPLAGNDSVAAAHPRHRRPPASNQGEPRSSLPSSASSLPLPRVVAPMLTAGGRRHHRTLPARAPAWHPA